MSEQRYTLEEAERVLKERECRWHGHDLTFLSTFVTPNPYRVFCGNCNKSWTVIEDE